MRSRATACLEGKSPALVFYWDGNGFGLGLDRDLRVYVPKEAEIELSQLNGGIKVTGDPKKFRVAHVFNTIAARG